MMRSAMCAVRRSDKPAGSDGVGPAGSNGGAGPAADDVIGWDERGARWHQDSERCDA